MALMYPAYLNPETKSNAEKKLFRLFQQMPCTDNWRVFHSVTTAIHPTQSMGEADFIVVIPDRAILILEVKGGGISCQNGIWYSKDYYGVVHEIKNPQEEANKAMRALMNYLRQKYIHINRCLFGFGVVFPDCDIVGKLSIPDLTDAQIADSKDCVIAKNLKDYLLRLAYFWETRSNKDIVPPNQQDCKIIEELIRPNFMAKVSVNTVIQNIEQQVIQLTENQQNTFEGILENERCLVQGRAGTGKTVLALNLAHMKTAEKKRTGLFCYNTQLADYLQKVFPQTEFLVCESFTEYAEKIARLYYPERIEKSNQQDVDEYYRELLPELLTDAFLEDKVPRFDFIIVDEAQDLMNSSYLDAFDAMLADGLKGSSWCMFTDANLQSIFNHLTEQSIKELLKARGIFYTSYTLRDNCRNAISIIRKMDTLFHITTRSHLSDEYGCDVECFACKNREHEKELLSKLLQRLKCEDVSDRDIVILSPCKWENSVVCQLTSYKITDSMIAHHNGIRFSTIQRFKGLESPVVILTDVDKTFGENDQKLLYVGMSRARIALYIFAFGQAVKHITSEKGLPQCRKLLETNI